MTADSALSCSSNEIPFHMCNLIMYVMSVVREQTVPSILKPVHLSNIWSPKFMSDKTESEKFYVKEKVTTVKVLV